MTNGLNFSGNKWGDLSPKGARVVKNRQRLVSKWVDFFGEGWGVDTQALVDLLLGVAYQ